MPETDLEKKVNEIYKDVAVIKALLEAGQVEERIQKLEEWKATETGFKKGVFWLISLLSGGAGAGIMKLLS